MHNRVQLKIDIDRDLHLRLKILAARTRTSIRALVTEAVTKLLDEREGGDTRPKQ